MADNKKETQLTSMEKAILERQQAQDKKLTSIEQAILERQEKKNITIIVTQQETTQKPIEIENKEKIQTNAQQQTEQIVASKEHEDTNVVEVILTQKIQNQKSQDRLSTLKPKANPQEHTKILKSNSTKQNEKPITKNQLNNQNSLPKKVKKQATQETPSRRLIITLVLVILGWFFAVGTKMSYDYLHFTDLSERYYVSEVGIEGQATIQISTSSVSDIWARQFKRLLCALEFEIDGIAVETTSCVNYNSSFEMLVIGLEPLNVYRGDSVIISIANPEIIKQHGMGIEETSFEYKFKSLGKELEIEDLTIKNIDNIFRYVRLDYNAKITAEELKEKGVYLGTYYKSEPFDFSKTITQSTSYFDSEKSLFNSTIVRSYEYDGEIYLLGHTGVYLDRIWERGSIGFYYEWFSESMIGIDHTNRTPEYVSEVLENEGFQELILDV